MNRENEEGSRKSSVGGTCCIVPSLSDADREAISDQLYDIRREMEALSYRMALRREEHRADEARFGVLWKEKDRLERRLIVVRRCPAAKPKAEPQTLDELASALANLSPEEQIAALVECGLLTEDEALAHLSGA